MKLAFTILILLKIPSTETCPILSKNTEIVHDTMDAVILLLSKTMALLFSQVALRDIKLFC
jgi:hypothetical protein